MLKASCNIEHICRKHDSFGLQGVIKVNLSHNLYIFFIILTLFSPKMIHSESLKMPIDPRNAHVYIGINSYMSEQVSGNEYDPTCQCHT